MATIKCPHCGANNQDVTASDSCWKCGTGLGSPSPAAANAIPDRPVDMPVSTVSQTADPPAPSSEAATKPALTPPPPMTLQAQKSTTPLPDTILPPVEKQQAPAPRTVNTAMIVTVCLVLALVILLIWYLRR